ncbi:MAG TPA: GntR family transcriptional regulator [Spirochaetales bacterium]|nr:GntR family transcriptional regulator [Spirochaetales bacterium]
MDFKLEKRRGLPYYIQLKNYIKSRIESGAVENGKLPPVRQVAHDFGVSVNTVLRAYDELGKEGMVTGAVGKGTFITTTPQELKRQTKHSLLRKIIEHSLEEALSLEFTIEEFQETAEDYIREKLELMQKINLSFIECNIEQINYFTDHLELDPHIQRLPVLLDDLVKQKTVAIDKISKSDILVTSFHHLDEAREYLTHLNKPIIGINLEPEVTTLIEIAKISPESRLGIVTTSAQFGKIIREILENLDLNFMEILATNSRDGETVRSLVSQCNAVLVSPKRKVMVKDYAGAEIKVIEFVFTPDRTSINNLKVALLELKKSFI